MCGRHGRCGRCTHVLCLPLVLEKLQSPRLLSHKSLAQWLKGYEHVAIKIAVEPGELVRIQTVNQPYCSHRIFSSFLRYLDNSIWCTKWKKLATWWPWAYPRPTGAWGMIMLTLVTPPYYLTINQSELRMSWSHILKLPSFILILKMIPWNSSKSSGFSSISCPESLSGALQ